MAGRSVPGHYTTLREADAATVIKLRSRLESSARSQMSPNRTSSVSDTIFGKKSPIIFCAGVCACDSDMFFLLFSHLPLNHEERRARGRVNDMLAPHSSGTSTA